MMHGKPSNHMEIMTDIIEGNFLRKSLEERIQNLDEFNQSQKKARDIKIFRNHNNISLGEKNR
jgi:ketol-acid reductoisomerase